MADVPVSSSAHARRVQILVWSGSASITVVQTLLALLRYLELEGGSTVVPGLARWQVMYPGPQRPPPVIVDPYRCPGTHSLLAAGGGLRGCDRYRHA